MRCPQCNALQLKGQSSVIEARRKEHGYVTRRTRQCSCGFKFKTYERAENSTKNYSKLSERQKEKIYKHRDWYTSEELSDLFDVHVSTIREIKRTQRPEIKLQHATDSVKLSCNLL